MASVDDTQSLGEYELNEALEKTELSAQVK